MGLPVVNSLRQDHRYAARVWPFETGLKGLDKTTLKDCDVVLAEIYPSLVAPRSESSAVKDSLQVQAMVGHLKALDDDGRLGDVFAGADDLTEAEAGSDRDRGGLDTRRKRSGHEVRSYSGRR